MEKYIVSALVIASGLYLAAKAFGAWNRKSNCDSCTTKCNSRAGCGQKVDNKEQKDRENNKS